MDIILSLASGVARAFSNLNRKIASQHMSEIQMLFWLRIIAFAILAIIGLVIQIELPVITTRIVTVIIGVGVLESMATFYSFKAIKNGNLSVVAPLEASTPLFLIPVGFILLGERLSPSNFLAVLLLVAGVYLLLLDRRTHWTTPFKEVFTNVVTFSVIIYAFLTAITISGDKFLLRYMDVYWVLIIITFMQAVFSYLYALINGSKIRLLVGDYTHITASSVFTVISRGLELAALGLGASSLIIGIRKIDTLITVLLAKWRLKETLERHQYIAIGLILFGIIAAAI